MAQRKTDERTPPARQEVDAPPSTDTPDRQAAYTVLARRYRPQQFADLVGQEAVGRALVNALENNRVAHAYLFTGARGVGKTSTARILAKALNCVQGPTATPCDICTSCKAIATGDDVDVIEIDGASNNSVDDVRELRQNAQYHPSRSRYKIYIIDEVHMLAASAQKSAFNALLKTLEEPPPHVKFIFATTEVQKIPATILSRCQRFDFAGIASRQIVDRLREVVAAEGMLADDEALELVARRAGGSMRDAQSLLDQLLAFGSDRLTVDQVHQLLGTAHDDRVAALAAAVLDHDPRQALDLLADGAHSGLQLGELLDQLIDYWRDLMVIQCAGDAARDLSVPPRLRPVLAKQAAAISLDTLLAGLDVLSTTKNRLRGSNHARVLLEMALVRLGRLDNLASLAQLGQWLTRGGPPPTAAPAASPAAPPRAVPRLAPLADEKKKVEAPEPAVASLVGSVPTRLGRELPGDRQTSGTVTKAGPAVAIPALASATPATPNLAEIWQKTLAQMPRLLASQLEKAKIPAISGPNTLVIGFEPEYTSQCDYCQDPKRLSLIEEKLRQVAGVPWSLRIESIEGERRTTPTADDSESSLTNSRRQREEALKQEPLVRRMIDALEAVVLRVDDGFGAAPASPRSENGHPQET